MLVGQCASTNQPSQAPHIQMVQNTGSIKRASSDYISLDMLRRSLSTKYEKPIISSTVVQGNKKNHNDNNKGRTIPCAVQLYSQRYNTATYNAIQQQSQRIPSSTMPRSVTEVSGVPKRATSSSESAGFVPSRNLESCIMPPIRASACERNTAFLSQPPNNYYYQQQHPQYLPPSNGPNYFHPFPSNGPTTNRNYCTRSIVPPKQPLRDIDKPYGNLQNLQQLNYTNAVAIHHQHTIKSQPLRSTTQPNESTISYDNTFAQNTNTIRMSTPFFYSNHIDTPYNANVITGAQKRRPEMSVTKVQSVNTITQEPDQLIQNNPITKTPLLSQAVVTSIKTIPSHSLSTKPLNVSTHLKHKTEKRHSASLKKKNHRASGASTTTTTTATDQTKSTSDTTEPQQVVCIDSKLQKQTQTNSIRRHISDDENRNNNNEQQKQEQPEVTTKLDIRKKSKTVKRCKNLHEQELTEITTTENNLTDKKTSSCLKDVNNHISELLDPKEEKNDEIVESAAALPPTVEEIQTQNSTSSKEKVDVSLDFLIATASNAVNIKNKDNNTNGVWLDALVIQRLVEGLETLTTKLNMLEAKQRSYSSVRQPQQQQPEHSHHKASRSRRHRHTNEFTYNNKYEGDALEYYASYALSRSSSSTESLHSSASRTHLNNDQNTQNSSSSLSSPASSSDHCTERPTNIKRHMHPPHSHSKSKRYPSTEHFSHKHADGRPGSRCRRYYSLPHQDFGRPSKHFYYPQQSPELTSDDEETEFLLSRLADHFQRKRSRRNVSLPAPDGYFIPAMAKPYEPNNSRRSQAFSYPYNYNIEDDIYTRDFNREGLMSNSSQQRRQPQQWSQPPTGLDTFAGRPNWMHFDDIRRFNEKNFDAVTEAQRQHLALKQQQSAKPSPVQHEHLYSLRIESIDSNVPSRVVEVVRIHVGPEILVISNLLTTQECDALETVKEMSESFPLLNKIKRRIAALLQVESNKVSSLETLRCGSHEPPHTWPFMATESIDVLVFLTEIQNGGMVDIEQLGLTIRPQRRAAVAWRCSNLEEAQILRGVKFYPAEDLETAYILTCRITLSPSGLSSCNSNNVLPALADVSDKTTDSNGIQADLSTNKKGIEVPCEENSNPSLFTDANGKDIAYKRSSSEFDARKLGKLLQLHQALRQQQPQGIPWLGRHQSQTLESVREEEEAT